jgi:hypothetical protein
LTSKNQALNVLSVRTVYWQSVVRMRHCPGLLEESPASVIARPLQVQPQPGSGYTDEVM